MEVLIYIDFGMIHLHKEDNITVVRLELNSRNSFSLTDIMELTNIVDQLDDDQSVKGIIIVGTGKVFSTGGNLSEFKNLDTEEKINDFFKSMDILIMKLFSFNKPLIVAANGHAIGLGFLIQICADCVVSYRNSKIKFGLPESKIGLIVDKVMIELLNWNNINGKILSNLILRGELFNIDEAINLKAVDLLTNESDLIEFSKQHLFSLLQDNPVTFSVNKKLIRECSFQEMKTSFENKTYSLYAELLINNSVTRKSLEIQ